MGLALRAAGHGLPVVIAQFLKDGSSGECRILRTLPNVTVLSANPCGKFSFQMDVCECAETGSALKQLFHEAAAQAQSPGLLILDEICAALSCGFLQEEEVLHFLHTKPAGLEVVMTGRAPSNALRAAADYLSEIHNLRHPYQRGVAAREGVER